MFLYFGRKKDQVARDGARLALNYKLAELRMILATAVAGDRYVDIDGTERVWAPDMRVEVEEAITELVDTIATLI